MGAEHSVAVGAVAEADDREGDALGGGALKAHAVLVLGDVDAEDHPLRCRGRGLVGPGRAGQPGDGVDLRSLPPHGRVDLEMEVWVDAAVGGLVRVDGADALAGLHAGAHSDVGVADDVTVDGGAGAVGGGVVDDEPPGGVGSAEPGGRAGVDDGAALGGVDGVASGAAGAAVVGAAVDGAPAGSERAGECRPGGDGHEAGHGAPFVNQETPCRCAVRGW